MVSEFPTFEGLKEVAKSLAGHGWPPAYPATCPARHDNEAGFPYCELGVGTPCAGEKQCTIYLVYRAGAAETNDRLRKQGILTVFDAICHACRPLTGEQVAVVKLCLQRLSGAEVSLDLLRQNDNDLLAIGLDSIPDIPDAAKGDTDRGKALLAPEEEE